MKKAGNNLFVDLSVTLHLDSVSQDDMVVWYFLVVIIFLNVQHPDPWLSVWNHWTKAQLHISDEWARDTHIKREAWGEAWLFTCVFFGWPNMCIRVCTCRVQYANASRVYLCMHVCMSLCKTAESLVRQGTYVVQRAGHHWDSHSTLSSLPLLWEWAWHIQTFSLLFPPLKQSVSRLQATVRPLANSVTLLWPSSEQRNPREVPADELLEMLKTAKLGSVTGNLQGWR